MTEHRVGPRIRRTRESRGISLRSLATRIEVSPATLSAIERGLTPLTVDRLEQIALVLDVEPAQLLASPAERPGTLPAPAPDERDWRSFDGIATGPVLDSAVRLFVRQGFHATSMREIAAGAGLSVAGVYHHYPSKEQLLVALLDLTMGELAWRVEAARREGDGPAESFALMVEALALFHATRGDLAFIGASEMRAFSPPQRRRLTGLRDRIQHALDRQATACLAGEGFSVDDLRTATRAIATMCTSLPSWFRAGGPLSAADVARSYSGYALALLAQVGEPRSPAAAGS